MIKVLAINIGGWKCSCNKVKRAIISTEQEEAALFNQIGSDHSELLNWTDRSEQWLPTHWAEQQSRWPATQHRLWQDSSSRSGWAEPDLEEVNTVSLTSSQPVDHRPVPENIIIMFWLIYLLLTSTVYDSTSKILEYPFKACSVI